MRSRSPQFRVLPVRFTASRGSGAAPRVRSFLAAVSSVLLALVATVLVVAGCTNKGSQSPNAQSTERQSEAEYQLAVDLFEKGNVRAALDHTTKALALNEENDKAQYFGAVISLSFCSTNRGVAAPDCRLSEVERYARAALKANPEFRDAKNLLGQTLVNEKRCKEAIQVLEPLTKDPAYVHPYFAWGNLGDAQLCDGQVDASIASLKNAVAEPRFCVGHHRLGLAYEKKRDLPSAEASFTNAVTADPGCENLQDAWWGRCRVRKQLGNAEWKKDCEKCREISAETPTGKLCIQTLGVGAVPAAPSPASPPSPPSASSPASSPRPPT